MKQINSFIKLLLVFNLVWAHISFRAVDNGGLMLYKVMTGQMVDQEFLDENLESLE